MNFKKVGLACVAAFATSLFVSACGGDGGEGGDTLHQTCIDDSGCATDELCHPTAKVCVRTCTEATECPESAPQCNELDAQPGTSICQCTTDELCNSGTTDGTLTCSLTDAVCVPSCTSDTDCSGTDVCNTTTGLCEPGGTGETCTFGTCGDGEVCTNGQCAAGASCSGEGQSTCAYGQFCNAGKCDDVAPNESNITKDFVACENFANNSVEWSSTQATQGPVIYSLEKTFAGQDPNEGGTGARCTAGQILYKVKLKAYNPTADFPTDRDSLQGFFYVRVNGTEVDGTTPDILQRADYKPNGKNVEMELAFCPVAPANEFQPGFFFTNGNAICGQFSR